MYWGEEGTVSVHKIEELSRQDLDMENMKVGDVASCLFKKKLYEGKIAGIGKAVACSNVVCDISLTFQSRKSI